MTNFSGGTMDSVTLSVSMDTGEHLLTCVTEATITPKRKGCALCKKVKLETSVEQFIGSETATPPPSPVDSECRSPDPEIFLSEDERSQIYDLLIKLVRILLQCFLHC